MNVREQKLFSFVNPSFGDDFSFENSRNNGISGESTELNDGNEVGGSNDKRAASVDTAPPPQGGDDTRVQHG